MDRNSGTKIENQSWCPVPWKSIAMQNDGNLRVCCISHSSEGNGLLLKNSGEIYNAATADLNEARNSPLLKEIRLSMLRGQEHPACTRCNTEDAIGGRSLRQIFREQWQDRFREETANACTKADGGIDATEISVDYYDIRLGNQCNLRCRMCGPASSSGWYREYFETTGKGFRAAQRRIVLQNDGTRVAVIGENPFEWHSRAEKFWDQLLGDAHVIRSIQISGGEPFLIERHFDFLRDLIERGRPENISLEYNSNITFIPERAWELWKKFRSVKIGASIDAAGSLNDYIRYPSEWSRIEKNLDLIDRAPGNFHVWVVTTLQIYNILAFPDLLRWLIEKQFQRVQRNPIAPFVSAHNLYNPSHLSTQALPRQTKERVSTKFSDFYKGWFLPYVEQSSLAPEIQQNWKSKMLELLRAHEAYMWSQDRSQLLGDFWAYNAKQDTARGSSLQHHAPEIFSDICCELGLPRKDL